MSTARMVPRRIVVAVTLYGSFALLGALAGMRYYLPHPPALSDSFVMTDLRHAGAVSGALVGGVVAAVIARRFSHSAVSLKFSFLGLLPFGPLAFILLQRDLLPGWTTIALLTLPWVLAYSTSLMTRAVPPVSRPNDRRAETVV